MEYNNFFPIGVWYNGSHSRPPMMPDDTIKQNELEKGLKSIKNRGLNTIKYWVDWARCNPKSGEYNFEQVETFLSAADKIGINVVIQIYLDSAPNWISKIYPDSLFEAQTGHKVESQASPGYSLDNPKVRKIAQEFMTKLAKVASKHESLYAWDSWSEPHLVNWSWFDYMGPDPWFDYNEHSRKRFIDWLKKKYLDLEILNRYWYRTYSDWDEIKMPKYVTLSTFKDIIDLQEFVEEKIAEDLEMRVQSIRRGDEKSPIASHSAITSVMTSIMEWGGNGNDWKTSTKSDIWGTSYYPAHIGSLNPYPPYLSGLFLDATRSASENSNKPIWIGELQCGQAVEGLNFGAQVGPKDVWTWTWQCISRGAKGLFYYAYYPMSCGEEISGFGLLNFNEEGNEKLNSIEGISKIVNRNRDIFLRSTTYHSSVAILVSSKTKQILTALRSDQKILTSSLVGLYKFFYDLKVPIDFLDLSHSNTQDLMKYKLVWYPLPIILSQSDKEKIKEFVENGGHFIAEFRPNWSDEFGKNNSGIPGLELEELFGSREKEVRRKEVHKMQTYNLNKNKIFKYEGQYEILESLSSKEILKDMDGNVVATENFFGNGKITYFGLLLSSMLRDEKGKTIHNTIKEIIGEKIDECTYPIYSTDPGVETVVRCTNNAYILYFFNNSGHDLLSLNLRIRVKDSQGILEDIINNKVVKVLINNNKSKINVKLKSKDLIVYILKNK